MLKHETTINKTVLEKFIFIIMSVDGSIKEMTTTKSAHACVLVCVCVWVRMCVCMHIEKQTNYCC